VRQPREIIVLVHRQGAFLVLHRSPRYEGYWHPVAGGVEVGETEAEAARREVLEEVGLDAEVRPLGIGYSYALRKEVPEELRPQEVSVECFSLEAPAAWEPTLNHEHDDYRWCTVDEAVGLLHWPEPREVVRELARRLGG